MSATARRRALFVTTGPPGEFPIAQLLADRGVDVEHRAISEGSSPRQIIDTLIRARDISRFDIVVASEYTTAFALGLAAILRRSRAKMTVVGLNLSRRPLAIGFGPIDRMIDRAFRRYDNIVVHSEPEKKQFADLHGLDQARMTFINWGFDLPDVADVSHLVPNTPYVAMVGRNNRDFETVARALEGTGIAGVFVGWQGTGTNIHGYAERPFAECLGIMRGAIANIIALKDGERGAGHITAVGGMLLERPHIFSNAEVITGYLADGMEGIAVPFRNVDAMRHAILTLANDPALAASMGQAGRRRALAQMSNQVFAERVASVIAGTQP